MILNRGLAHWLPQYLLEARERAKYARARQSQLTHVFFLVCDHYEPRHRIADEAQPAERLRTWQVEYPKFQRRCQTAFGHVPLHTWFYPPHHGLDHLNSLANMVFDGGGEVELHYHHENDTAETLRRDLLATLDAYNSAGLLLESGAPPRRNFGFVHGDWTLDNACNGWKCGVNGELSILQGLGCWADFTMPSANEAQTRKINSIYYAIDSPSRRKSHDRGTDARVGITDREGFLLMQGPLGINWSAPRYPRVENASLTSLNWGRPDRIRKWIDCNVHVKGRPDWLFVKLHTHGAIERDFDALFGEKAFEMHYALNEYCNDGKEFQLHYVTARQAYNLVKSAEAGKSGDPRPWVDFSVGTPVASLYTLNAKHRVTACTSDRLRIVGISGEYPVRLKTHIGAVRQIDGHLESVQLDVDADTVELVDTAPGREISLKFSTGVDLTESMPYGASMLRGPSPSEWRIRLSDASRAMLRIRRQAAPHAA